MTLDSMNNSGLWLTIKTPSCELRALNAIHGLRLMMTRKTLSREFRALTMNISRLWLTGTTSGHELKALDAINN